MIRFTLKCDNQHKFDSWFQSAKAFEKLRAAGMVACAVCGSSTVEKALMAPRIGSGRTDPPKPAPPSQGAIPDSTGAAGAGPLSTPASAAEQALADLKRRIERSSENVGANFPREARDMHAGIVPERPIHGQACLEEAKELLEEGVPITPLPFMPGRKPN